MYIYIHIHAKSWNIHNFIHIYIYTWNNINQQNFILSLWGTFRCFCQQNLQVLGSSISPSPFVFVGPLKEAAADFFWPPKTRVPVFLLEGNVWKPIGTEFGRVRMGSTSTSKKPTETPGWKFVEGIFLGGGRQPEMEGKFCRCETVSFPLGMDHPCQQSPNKNTTWNSKQHLFVSMDSCLNNHFPCKDLVHYPIETTLILANLWNHSLILVGSLLKFIVAFYSCTLTKSLTLT